MSCATGTYEDHTMTLSTSRVKDHLRIDGTDDDAYIATLVTAAETAVLNYLDVEDMPAAAPVEAAVLLLIGSL